MGFNIGDMVKIRPDLDVNSEYNGICVIPYMVDLANTNKEWMIASKFKDWGINTYRLAGQEEAGFSGIWTDDMLILSARKIEIKQSELADFLGI